jgi:hypothetical protein
VPVFICCRKTKADVVSVGEKGILCMPTKNFNPQSDPASSEKSKTRPSSCHHERHLNGVALKIYNMMWRLAKQSKTDSVAMTNQRIAKCIGAVSSKRADYITRAKMPLCRDGWLEFLGVSKGARAGTWSGGRYRAVSHEEWAENKAAKLGGSPCNPQPLQTKVSTIHPGGRAYQMRLKNEDLRKAEARTVKQVEARTVKPEKESYRACEEARTFS